MMSAPAGASPPVPCHFSFLLSCLCISFASPGLPAPCSALPPLPLPATALLGCQHCLRLPPNVLCRRLPVWRWSWLAGRAPLAEWFRRLVCAAHTHRCAGGWVAPRQRTPRATLLPSRATSRTRQLGGLCQLPCRLLGGCGRLLAPAPAGSCCRLLPCLACWPLLLCPHPPHPGCPAPVSSCCCCPAGSAALPLPDRTLP